MPITVCFFPDIRVRVLKGIKIYVVRQPICFHPPWACRTSGIYLIRYRVIGQMKVRNHPGPGPQGHQDIRCTTAYMLLSLRHKPPYFLHMLHSRLNDRLCDAITYQPTGGVNPFTESETFVHFSKNAALEPSEYADPPYFLHMLHSRLSRYALSPILL